MFTCFDQQNLIPSRQKAKTFYSCLNYKLKSTERIGEPIFSIYRSEEQHFFQFFFSAIQRLAFFISYYTYRSATHANNLIAKIHIQIKNCITIKRTI